MSGDPFRALVAQGTRAPRPLRFLAPQRLSHDPLLAKLDAIAALEPLSAIRSLAGRLLSGASADALSST